MPRALHHDLHVELPGPLGQFSQGVQFGELRGVVGVRRRARPQAVAQGEGDVVLREDLAQLVEVRVEEVFLVVGQAPAGHDGAAAGHDAGDPVRRERHVPQQHAGVDGHVVHTLFALLDHGVAEDFPGQGVRFAVDLLQRLVDRDRADRHGGVADEPFTGGVDVVAGGQVHHGVRAPLGGPLQLVHFLGDGAGDGRVADVGVDLHQEGLADDHRLGFRVVDVGGDDGAAGSDFAADQFHVAVLAEGHKPHLGGDDALPRIVHLRHGLAVDGTAGHRPGALPLGGRRAAAHGGLAVVEQVPFPAVVRLGVCPGRNPFRTERLQAHHRIAARTRRAVDPERSVLLRRR